jgi:hypothetical protein
MEVSSPAGFYLPRGFKAPLRRRPRIFHGGEPEMEEDGRLERYGVTRASASNGARPLAGSPSVVGKEGVEPSRLPALVPETSVAAITPLAHGADDGDRTRDLKAARLPDSATSAWSRHPVPTRAVRRTKAEPQPCAAAWLPGLDSNPAGAGFRALLGHLCPTRNRVRGAGLEPAHGEV